MGRLLHFTIKDFLKIKFTTMLHVHHIYTLKTEHYRYIPYHVLYSKDTVSYLVVINNTLYISCNICLYMITCKAIQFHAMIKLM